MTQLIKQGDILLVSVDELPRGSAGGHGGRPPDQGGAH
jgi:hypothetical protein